MSEWRGIPGWETYYEISDTGRVRSLDRKIVVRDVSGRLGPRHYKGKVLNTNRRNGSYLVTLARPGEKVFRLVRELYQEVFLSEMPAGAKLR